MERGYALTSEYRPDGIPSVLSFSVPPSSVSMSLYISTNLKPWKRLLSSSIAKVLNACRSLQLAALYLSILRDAMLLKEL